MAGWAKPKTFARCWADSVDSRPDSPFLVFERATDPDGAPLKWTYREFDAEVQRVAARLVELGVGDGSRVHLALTNTPAFVAIWLATVRLGASIVASDPMGMAPELADHIERTAPAVGFCALDRSDTYSQAVAQAGISVAVIAVDETGDFFSEFAFRVFDKWAEPELTSVAGIMFTSGTTGKPKGVEITQANYAFAGHSMAEAARLEPDDRHIVALPLFHANAQYYSFASAIWVGASVALMPAFSASRFVAQAARYEATVASLFAAPIRMILARGGPSEGILLRHCWFAQNLSQDDFATISEWFGCRPRQLYGMTETIAAVLTDRSESPEPHVMGTPTGGCQVKLSETGEILVGGEPGISLFAGYLDNEAETKASFADGWFKTGDKASIDDLGRFHFGGRRSDVLKVAGENVSTAEVEAVLLAHPAVAEAAVVGAPDPIRDEVPVAFVVATAGARLDTDDLTSWCEGRLSKPKRPSRFEIMDSLPRTSVGKVRTFILRQLAKPEGVKS